MQIEEFDWDELFEQIRGGRDWGDEGQVIPIIGNRLLAIEAQNADGNFKEVGFGRWLAESLATSLKIDTETLRKSFDLGDVICAHAPYRSNPASAYSKVRAIYKKQPPSIPRALADIASITDFKYFVAATADDLLARALKNARQCGCFVIHNDRRPEPDLTDELEESSAPVVFQLFGSIAKAEGEYAGEYALSEEDMVEYMHCLQQPTERPQRMFDQLRKKHLLLLGVEYPDWLTRFLLRATREDRLRAEAPNVQYVVESRMGPEDRLANFLREQTSSTKFVECDPVEFAAEMVRQWRERFPDAAKAITSPVMPTPVSDRPDVFVSYCREDREAAGRIYKKLTDHGINAWMDNRLDDEPGVEYTDRIFGLIDRCRFFLPVISSATVSDRNASKGRYFRREWERADARLSEFAGVGDRVFVLPCLIDETILPNERLKFRFDSKHSPQAPEGKLSDAFCGWLKLELERLTKMELGPA